MAFQGHYVAVPRFGQPAQFGQFNPPQVSQLQVRKNLTCRYWFYSQTGCPDNETDCPYAHADTGSLSPYGTQRDTCWHWKYAMGGCKPPDGSPCKFEHRETGCENDAPPRTGQDRRWHAHKLTGINLAIANAAEKAGFKVADKKALMELVFAVRRAGGLGDSYRPKPPYHTIYPDKYRPGKRGREDEGERGGVVGIIGGHVVTAAGTVGNPINLEEDVETGGACAQQPNSSAKRQKINVNTGIPNVHPARRHMVNDSRAGTPNLQTSRRARTAQPQSRRARRSASPPHRRSGRSLSPRRYGLEDTGSALWTVGQYLAKNTERINDCGNIMRGLWGADKRFQRQDVIPILQDLRYHFDECAKRTEGAFHELDRVIRIMRGDYH